MLALASDGTVWAWGANDVGQVGDGTTVDRASPLGVLSGAVGIDAGPDFSLAWTADGTLWSWGANGRGQLGDGSVLPCHTPAEITTLTGVSLASAGRGHVLALAGGMLWAGRPAMGV